MGAPGEKQNLEKDRRVVGWVTGENLFAGGGGSGPIVRRGGTGSGVRVARGGFGNMKHGLVRRNKKSSMVLPGGGEPLSPGGGSNSTGTKRESGKRRVPISIFKRYQKKMRGRGERGFPDRQMKGGLFRANSRREEVKSNF